LFATVCGFVENTPRRVPTDANANRFPLGSDFLSKIVTALVIFILVPVVNVVGDVIADGIIGFGIPYYMIVKS
jgi:hypothetical protein